MPEKDLPTPKKIYPSPFSVRLNIQERDELKKLAEGHGVGFSGRIGFPA